MNDEKKTTTIEDTIEQAEQLEAEAQAEPNLGTYTHTFKRPFVYEGRTYEELTFNWEGLSGKDSVAGTSEPKHHHCDGGVYAGVSDGHGRAGLHLSER